jgi:hypothetical protein
MISMRLDGTLDAVFQTREHLSSPTDTISTANTYWVDYLPKGFSRMTLYSWLGGGASMRGIFECEEWTVWLDSNSWRTRIICIISACDVPHSFRVHIEITRKARLRMVTKEVDDIIGVMATSINSAYFVLRTHEFI